MVQRLSIAMFVHCCYCCPQESYASHVAKWDNYMIQYGSGKDLIRTVSGCGHVGVVTSGRGNC